MALIEIETPPRPTTKGAAADGALVGRANAEAILRCLREHGSASAPSVGAAIGVSDVTVRLHLHKLAADGLAVKAGTRWSLTPAGIARTGPTTSAADVATVLDRLPSEAHRAMARLVLDAVVIRFHRAEHGGIGWPSFGLWGPAGLGKTTVPRLVGRLLGLADHEHVRVVSDVDRAELFGRRTPDGTGGYRWAPSAALGLPLLTLDEIDKARGETKDLALRFLQGDSLLVQEQTTVTVRPTPVVTFNAGKDPRDVLPSDRLRRMVHVNVAGAASPAACRSAARALFDAGPLPVLDLGRLVPPEVGTDTGAFFDDELTRFLAPAGETIYPGHALSMIVGGRMARDGTDNETATMAVARDYLTTAETWGGTTTVAIARYHRHYGGEAPEPATENVAVAIDVDTRNEAVELAEDKAVGAKVIAAALVELGPTDDEEGTRLRAAFGEIKRQLAAAKSIAEAEHIIPVFDGLQERAEQRARAIAGRRMVNGQKPVVGGRHRVPDRRAVFDELLAVGSKDPPAKVLARLGLVAEDPLPPGMHSDHGRRWSGTSPATRGAVVWDADPWTDLAVKAILIDARDRQPVPGRPTLVAG